MRVTRSAGHELASASPARRDRVRAIPVPDQARAVCTLEQIDYADAFTVDVDHARDRLALPWLRLIFDGAPPALRLRLWAAWIGLGLRLGPPLSSTRVLGWEVERVTSDLALVGAGSRIGMPAQLLLMRLDGSLLLDTFVQQTNPLAHAAWAAIEPAHRITVPTVLADFTRRTNATEVQ